MNKTTIKNKHKTHKNNIQYRKLRRWVLPAVLGAALSTLAFLPTFAEDIPSAPPAGNPPMSAPNGPVPKAEANPNTFTGTTVVTENKAIAHELISNTTSDQNAFIGKDKAVVIIENSVFDKAGNTTSDNNSNFRGQNAVILGTDGSQINIKGSNITSNSNGSNAVFATGEGSVINVENTNIHTKSDSSRGLDATYKGTVNGKNLTITTEGAHSATLATDRGEGTITAEAAKLTTSGEGSPIIYSTGNITADYITGEAKNSEIGVVEGKNSITLTNSIFCKIANGEIPAATLYEDEDFRVILDLGPASKGHSLILPKKHAANIYELPDETAGKAMILAKKMAGKLTDALNCDGFNIVQNNGEIAGQTVFHFHMHLIPRYKGDEVGLTWKAGELSDEVRDEILKKVRD